MTNYNLKEYKINLTKKVDYDDWKRFEDLADENPRLWEIFWCLSKDKNLIKKNNMCGVDYFEEALMPNLFIVMKKMWLEKDVKIPDIEIIMTLFITMIPKDRCNNCNCIEKKKTNYVDFR